VLDRVATMAPARLLKCLRSGSLEFIETRRSHGGRKAQGRTEALTFVHCMTKGVRAVIH
jgi:hypothetical protein